MKRCLCGHTLEMHRIVRIRSGYALDACQVWGCRCDMALPAEVA